LIKLGGRSPEIVSFFGKEESEYRLWFSGKWGFPGGGAQGWWGEGGGLGFQDFLGMFGGFVLCFLSLSSTLSLFEYKKMGHRIEISCDVKKTVGSFSPGDVRSRRGGELPTKATSTIQTGKTSRGKPSIVPGSCRLAGGGWSY